MPQHSTHKHPHQHQHGDRSKKPAKQGKEPADQGKEVLSAFRVVTKVQLVCDTINMTAQDMAQMEGMSSCAGEGVARDLAKIGPAAIVCRLRDVKPDGRQEDVRNVLYKFSLSPQRPSRLGVEEIFDRKRAEAYFRQLPGPRAKEYMDGHHFREGAFPEIGTFCHYMHTAVQECRKEDPNPIIVMIAVYNMLLEDPAFKSETYKK